MNASTAAISASLSTLSNAGIHPVDLTTAILNPPEAGILAVNAPQAWSALGVSGNGVGVAVIDSGVGDHPDLAGRVVARARKPRNANCGRAPISCSPPPPGR